MNDHEKFLKKSESAHLNNKSSVIHRLISKTSKIPKTSEMIIDDEENSNTNISTNSTEILDIQPIEFDEKDDDFMKKTLCTQLNQLIFCIMMIFLVILLALLCTVF